MPDPKSKSPAKRLDPLAVFQDLGYEPHPGQLLVHQSRAPRRVLACGSRYGKSLCASMEACCALLEPRDECRGWIVAPTRDLADRIFVRTANTLRTHIPHRVQELDLRGQRIVVSNLGGGSSELRGKSADMPVTLLGEELDFLIVDEAAKLRDDIWDSYLAARLVNRQGWALLLSTPSGTNWFHRAFKRGQKKRDPDYESWQSPTWTNPYVDRAAIEAERSRSSADVFGETYEAKFIGAEPDPCERCQPVSPEARSILFLSASEMERRCSACNKLVDEEGRTLVPTGAKLRKIIWYDDDEEVSHPGPGEPYP